MSCQVIRSYIVSSCCLSSDHVNSAVCQFMLSVHFVRPSCPVKSGYVGMSFQVIRSYNVRSCCGACGQVRLSGPFVRLCHKVMLSTSIHVKLLLIQSLHSSPETPIQNVSNPSLTKFQGFNESLNKGITSPL